MFSNIDFTKHREVKNIANFNFFPEDDKGCAPGSFKSCPQCKVGGCYTCDNGVCSPNPTVQATCPEENQSLCGPGGTDICNQNNWECPVNGGFTSNSCIPSVCSGPTPTPPTPTTYKGVTFEQDTDLFIVALHDPGSGGWNPNCYNTTDGKLDPSTSYALMAAGDPEDGCRAGVWKNWDNLSKCGGPCTSGLTIYNSSNVVETGELATQNVAPEKYTVTIATFMPGCRSPGHYYYLNMFEATPTYSQFRNLGIHGYNIYSHFDNPYSYYGFEPPDNTLTNNPPYMCYYNNNYSCSIKDQYTFKLGGVINGNIGGYLALDGAGYVYTSPNASDAVTWMLVHHQQ